MKEESACILQKRKGSEDQSTLGWGGLVDAGGIDWSLGVGGILTLHVQQHPMHGNNSNTKQERQCLLIKKYSLSTELI